MAYTDYLDRVQEIYIGYYQRPADPAGLVYWAARLDASGGNLSEIIEAFANSTEAQELYGPINASTIDSVINQVYNSFFGRDAEAGGLAFYHNGFVNGTFTAATIMVNILDGATGLDLYSIHNKVEAANLFTETIDPGLDHADIQVTYSGHDDALAARDYLAGVTSDPYTIPTQAETTNFMITSGIADLGDPIFTHQQAVLTEETDFVDLSATGGITTVTGVQSADGTFNSGDTILGNDLTEVNLIADGGTGVFATVTDVAKIDVTGATDTTIEAMLFDNVGSINYVNGAGVQIFVDNLELGTQISVSDVGGTISASYDAGAASAYGWLYNGGTEEEASTFLIDADNNIAMDLADSASGSGGFWDGPVDVGTTTVTQGDNTWGEIWLEASGSDAASGDDVVAGNVTATIGDSATFTFFASANDDVTVGDVAMVGGNDSTLYYTVDEAGTDDLVGTVTLGDVSMTVGDSATADFFVEYIYGDVTVGDVDMTAGDSSYLTFSIEDVYNTSDEGAGNVTIGSLTMTAGDDSSIDAYVSECDVSGELVMGEVNLTAGDDSYITFTADSVDYGITIGNINIAAGASSTAYAYFSNQDAGYAVTLGDINVTAGDDSYLYVSVDNYGTTWTDGITVGNVDMAAGDDSEAYFYLYNYSTGTADTAATVDAGDVTVGNVSLEVGNVTSISSSATASVSITSEAYSGVAGDLTVGDISVAVGTGYVSATQTTEAFGYINVSLEGDDGAGDLTVGNITMTGGDFATLSFDINHSASDDMGALDVGSGILSFDAGESAYITVDIDNSVSYGDAGTVTLGDIDVQMGQDSYADVDIQNYAYSGNLADMTVGDVSIVSGDNSTADLYISSSAETGSNGAMTIGDITVALSATTTEDLIGGSTIFVSLEHYGWGSGDVFGDFTVGDIDLSAGDTADIDLYLYNEASADVVGSETVGNITITAGNASDVSIYSYFSASTDSGAISQMGDFTLAGVDVQMGDDAYLYGWMSVSQSDTAGDIGNVSYGNLAISVGDSADAYFGQYVFGTDDVESLSFGDLTVTMGEGGTVTASRYADIDGDLGSVSFGNITLTGGDDAYLDIDDGEVSVSGDLEGGVTIGNFDATIGDGATLSYSPSIDVSGSIGTVAVGNIDITAGEDAYVSYSLNVSGDEGIGDITLGDVTVVAGADASIEYLWFSGSATSGSIGDFAMGDVSLTLAEDAYVGYAGFTLDASGDIGTFTVGDVNIDLAAGASISELYFGAYAGASAGDFTAGDLTITAVDGEVTATSAGVFGTADVGLHTNGASVNVYYTLTSTDDATLTVGDITVNLDTLSDVNISISNTNGGVGNVVIGDLTVTGGVGVVTYTAGTAASYTAAGSFNLNVSDSGTTTIGDVDYSGYVGAVDIDMSWTDLGAANILGNGAVNTITGNAAANTIDAGAGDDVLLGGGGNDILIGGTGQDDETGGAGNDTFVFDDGDSGVTLATIDTIVDWSQVLNNADSLDFNYVAGSVQNYVEGTGSADLASFIAAANDNLNSTVRYFADTVGADTLVAVNFGSGDADMIVQLTGVNLGAIDHTDIIA